MGIKGIIFDLYGTLIDIETDESMEEICRAIIWEIRKLLEKLRNLWPVNYMKANIK